MDLPARRATVNQCVTIAECKSRQLRESGWPGNRPGHMRAVRSSQFRPFSSGAYSPRSVVAGSNRAACRAGIAEAANATRANTMGTATNVTGSAGRISKSRLRRTRTRRRQRETFEQAWGSAPLEELRVGNEAGRHVPGGIGRDGGDQPIGARLRERAQGDGVYDRECGCSHRDADGQQQDRSGGDGRPAPERAPGRPDVVGDAKGAHLGHARLA